MQIVIRHIGVDLLDQLADAAKRAAPNCLLSDQPEPALDLVEPTGVGGRVMEVVARPPREPSLNLGMLTSAVIVSDQMDIECRRDVAEGDQETREIPGDDGAVCT